MGTRDSISPKRRIRPSDPGSRTVPPEILTDPAIAYFKSRPEILTPNSIRLAVDFDHALTDNPFQLVEPPCLRDNAARAIRALYRSGWRIIITSSRFDSTVFSAETINRSARIVFEFLSIHHIPYDHIWKEQGGTPRAISILDGRSFPSFSGWIPTGTFLLSYMHEVERIWKMLNPYPFREAVRKTRIESGILYMEPLEDVHSELIYAYGRARAVRDGLLVNVSNCQASRKFSPYPVFASELVWQIIQTAVGNNPLSLEEVLRAIFEGAALSTRADGEDNVFEVKLRNAATGRIGIHDMRMVIGPGDDLEPVATISLVSED